MEALENGELMIEEDKHNEKPNGVTNGINMNGTSGNEKEEQRRPQRLLMHQLFGLFQKKYNFTIRNKKLLISQVN